METRLLNRYLVKQNSTGMLALLVCATLFSACSAEREVLVQDDLAFDGTCVRCHNGLSAQGVHPTFKLRCVDCHGGNDQVFDVPENAFENEETYRTGADALAWMEESHVRPQPDMARFFFANGLDDDGDGIIDEPPTFDGAGNVVDFGEIAELGLGGEGVGEFVDSELNRDLNYTRWLNPGDLRVATASCGGSSRLAQDGEAGGACHQRVIETVRRSVMVNQTAVTNGAYYGNESWRATFQNARDSNGPAFDPRAGAFGYSLDYTTIDGCITPAPDDEEDETGRAQPVFDFTACGANPGAQDPNAVAGAPGNAGLPGFEATQGTLSGRTTGTDLGQTFRHRGAASPRLPWGGNPLKDPRASLAQIQPIPAAELVPGIPDPVDLVLRGFRAYYPLNYPGSSNNLPFTFGESILPGIQNFVTNNPFGRGHSSGCTACHAHYNNDGSRDGTDPTTKHREFNPDEQDIVTAGGKQIIAGITVNRAERVRAVLGDGASAVGAAADAALEQRPQQKYYSSNHSLTSKITTDQCGLCHAFVTRINYAYQGQAEDEQRDALARRSPIQFSTPKGTQVIIHDSWVREEAIGGNVNDRTVVVPSGDAIAELARARDEDFEENGLLPGWGGCAPNVFTEDCNNNGELDQGLTLERVDESGRVIGRIENFNEDLNQNGVLDLISHVPRRNSSDGRQMRYVYGGPNGSTRQMDIHFERGMACIDCHMIQDVHGDGNIYSTNWDTIEIECEDCHGSTQNATLFTSGPNGGNNLRSGKGQNGLPFFDSDGNTLIQRSRINEGQIWRIPQVPDISNPKAALAHSSDHLPNTVSPGAHNTGSSFAGEPGESELTEGKLECYACHTSWIHNCMGCHFNVNEGDLVRRSVDAAGTVTNVAGENEVWFNNSPQAARTNFQLLEFMRSPFVLGVNAAADGHRLAPFRSSMEVHVTLTDDNGDTSHKNVTFTTFQSNDANSGRQGVATSGAAMNQTMPHTVRTFETRDCDDCHRLVDDQGRTRNAHVLGRTYGIGTGRYSYIGDWALLAGTPNGGGQSGIQLFDIKQENQLAGSAGASRFPGIVVNPNDRVAANAEPVFNGGGLNATFEATDAVLVRNFALGGQTPTLKDLAISTVVSGADGRLLISDITGRGHPSQVQPTTGAGAAAFVLDLPGAANALAHLAPDVSDPFIYVADGASGLSVVEILGAPGGGPAAALVTSAAIPGGGLATEVALAGDVAYVGTDTGSVEVFDLSDPRAPVHRSSVAIDGEVRGLAVAPFHLFGATSTSVFVLELRDPLNPTVPEGTDAPSIVAGIDAQELFYAGGELYVAAGAAGVILFDVTVPTSPENKGNIVQTIAPGQNVNAQDVITMKVPGQTWLLIAEAGGTLAGLKLDNTESTRERCLPAGSCGLDLDWRDPTIMGRDPSFDPNAGTFDAADPSGQPFFRIPADELSNARRIARPAYWEKMGTLTGRRYRDSFMPGSGVLSLPVMQKMYDVLVCEIPGTDDVNGNGLGELGLFENGNCSSSARLETDPDALSCQAEEICSQEEPPQEK